MGNLKIVKNISSLMLGIGVNINAGLHTTTSVITNPALMES
jgi:hypothetical protein